MIRRKPRDSGAGGRLTVFTLDGVWHVRYVTKIAEDGTIWSVPHHETTGYPGIEPFETWQGAMAHAATLRTYYGDQCRGDNLLFDARHPARWSRRLTA